MGKIPNILQRKRPSSQLRNTKPYETKTTGEKMMEWKYYVKHKCESLVYVPLGDINQVCRYGKICQKCAEPIYLKDVSKKFIARQRWAGKIWNPLSWLDFDYERKE